MNWVDLSLNYCKKKRKKPFANFSSNQSTRFSTKWSGIEKIVKVKTNYFRTTVVLRKNSNCFIWKISWKQFTLFHCTCMHDYYHYIDFTKYFLKKKKNRESNFVKERRRLFGKNIVKITFLLFDLTKYFWKEFSRIFLHCVLAIFKLSSKNSKDSSVFCEFIDFTYLFTIALHLRFQTIE